MDVFLARFSKATIAGAAIFLGILFIVFLDPPFSVCDTQIEVFREEQKLFLFVDSLKQKKNQTKLFSNFEQRQDDCLEANNAGGCYELFYKMRQVLRSLDTASEQCRKKVAYIPEVRLAIWESLELIVKIAWGAKPPTRVNKLNWLDTSDLNLFCMLKKQAVSLYGQQMWDHFREKMLKELPGAEALSRAQAWEGLLLSSNCSQFQ